MTPDDARHGSPAGYQAHRAHDEDPCDACRLARYRARKTQHLERLAGAQFLYSGTAVSQLLDPWLAMGISITALTTAAGIDTHRGSRILDGSQMRRRTYQALAAVTEDDLHPTSKVYSHLTVRRVYSLTAAGHTITSMPINLRGQWRYRDRMNIGEVRAVRDFYRAHQHQPGPSNNTRSRALNAGHRPPAAWDDPDTLAWPLGWTEPIVTAPQQDVDEVAVQRVLSGDWRCATSAADRREVIARWRAQGMSLRSLEKRTGWNTNRYTNTEVA